MEKKKYLREGKIDVTEEGITYWADKINCEKKDLRNAICCVGNCYNILVLFLELNRQIKKSN